MGGLELSPNRRDPLELRVIVHDLTLLLFMLPLMLLQLLLSSRQLGTELRRDLSILGGRQLGGRELGGELRHLLAKDLKLRLLLPDGRRGKANLLFEVAVCRLRRCCALL